MVEPLRREGREGLNFCPEGEDLPCKSPALRAGDGALLRALCVFVVQILLPGVVDQTLYSVPHQWDIPIEKKAQVLVRQF